MEGVPWNEGSLDRRETPSQLQSVPESDLGHGMPCPYILEPYVEHGEQAQRSNGGPVAWFGRRLVCRILGGLASSTNAID